MKASDPLLILAALFCPPLPIAILTGCSPDLYLNIFFTFCGFLPGVTHALYLILYPKARPEKLPAYSGDMKEKGVHDPLPWRKSDDTRVGVEKDVPRWNKQ